MSTEITEITAEAVRQWLGIDFNDADVEANIDALIQTANAYMVGALGENYPKADARVIQVQKALIADLYDHRELSDKVSGATRRLVDSMLLQVRLEMRDQDEV